MAPLCADSLRSSRGTYVDAGTRDEFRLDLGAEAFRLALERIEVKNVHFELFDSGHVAIEHPYPLALQFLAERLV